MADSLGSADHTALSRGPVDLSSQLEALRTYPSLGRLVEADDPAILTDMRSRLIQRQRGFERVIRQGPPQDAARATRVVRAYGLAIGLLAELESTVGKS
jgi:hypothetical protein